MSQKHWWEENPRPDYDSVYSLDMRREDSRVNRSFKTYRGNLRQGEGEVFLEFLGFLCMVLGFISYLVMQFVSFFFNIFGSFPRLNPRSFRETESVYFRNIGIAIIAICFGLLIITSLLFG